MSPTLSLTRLDRVYLLSLLVAAVAMACGGVEEGGYEEDEAAATGRTEVVTVDPSRHDGTSEVRAAVKGWTLWVSPVVTRRAPDANGREFVVTARVSKNVREAFAFVPDDAFGLARLLSKRKFEVAMDRHELATLVSGMPIFVRLVPESGTTVFAQVSLQGRFKVPTGSTSIWLNRKVQSVAVDRALVLRGKAALRSGATALTVTGTGAPALSITGTDANLDWTIDSFVAAVAGGGLTFKAKSSANRAISKKAAVELLVRTAGLTLDDPYDTWPSAECREPVKTCVADATRANRTDLGACGDYRPVMACVWAGASGGVDTSANAAVPVLQAAIRAYYEENRSDLEQEGAKSVEAAVSEVSAAGMNEITAQASAGTVDLTKYRLYVHGEVIHDTSSAYWEIRIDRTTGGGQASMVWE